MFAHRSLAAASRGQQLTRHATRAPRLACSLWDGGAKRSQSTANGGSGFSATAPSTSTRTTSPVYARRTGIPAGKQAATSEAPAASTTRASGARAPSSLKSATRGAAPQSGRVRPQRSIAPRPPPQSSEPEVINVDWDSNSFHGIATSPVSVEQYEELSKELPIADIAVKPDGIIYLPEIKYRRKLNEVFGPMAWGLIPKGEPVVTDNMVTREYALIINGRFASQSQGENTYHSPDQLPSSIEGCKSNALMRCCKDIGIASELWDPDFIRWFKATHMEDVWAEHATTGKKRAFWFKKGDDTGPAYPWKRI
jgi:hypothetical protein